MKKQDTHKIIKNMLTDYGIAVDTSMYNIGKFLLTSLSVGPNADSIAKISKLSRSYCRKLAKKAREEGIFTKNNKVCLPWVNNRNVDTLITSIMLLE